MEILEFVLDNDNMNLESKNELHYVYSKNVK